MKRFSRLLIIAAAFILGVMSASAVDTPVKREMRASWLATVWRLDWPGSVIGTVESNKPAQIAQQKKEMIILLDSLEINNFNAVYFQVRGRSDAFYKSSYEPWSEDLVSKRGNDPGYDPLAFVVEECHKRGMECHAWFNPYRYESQIGQWNGRPGCYRTEHPDWLLDHGGASILNPGKKEVTQRIVDIIREVVRNYDIDGVVFDDYFYIQGTTDAEDQTQYDEYLAEGGKLGRKDWRRENVNNMVRSVYNMIQEEKSWVRFGISPAGIACTSSGTATKYGVTACPTGSDWQYDGIYSEPLQWLKDHSIDYISPQVYWTIGNSTDYSKAVPWWNETAAHFNRQMYVSHSISTLTAASKGGEEAMSLNERNIKETIGQRASGPNSGSFAEYANEVRINRESSVDGNPGSVFYSTKFIYKNAPLFGNYLRKTVFNTPSLMPTLSYKAGNNPGVVKNIKVEGNKITWDGYENVRYTVYAVPTTTAPENFQQEVEYLMGISYDTSYTIPDDKLAGYNYAICVYDRVGNEYSAAFAGLATKPLATPVLKTPAANETIEAPFTFVWNAVPNASIYSVEVAYDKEFTKMVATARTTQTTLLTSVFELLPVDVQLYWRVRAMANGYIDGVSEATPFKSIMIHVTSPADGSVNQSLTPTITWSPADRNVILQISNTLYFDKIVYEKEVSSGSHTVEPYSLGSNTKYFVRFSYKKEGEQIYSPVISFTTKVAEVVPTTITYPTEGGQFYGDNVIIAEKVEGADKVTFEVAKSNTFPSRTKLTDVTSTGVWTSRPMSQLTSSKTFWKEGTTYYFRALVQFIDAIGNIVKSQYSPVVSAVYSGETGGISEVEADGVKIVDNVLYLNGEKANVVVYNTAGMEVMNVETDEDVELSMLSKGLYLVKVSMEGNTVTLKYLHK